MVFRTSRIFLNRKIKSPRIGNHGNDQEQGGNTAEKSSAGNSERPATKNRTTDSGPAAASGIRESCAALFGAAVYGCSAGLSRSSQRSCPERCRSGPRL